MTQKGYFESYKYDTPVKEKLNILEKFKLNNRLYFIYKYAIIVFISRKQARSGIYDDKLLYFQVY
jgi:hypothetical protein